jgi:hypothetical protein
MGRPGRSAPPCGPCGRGSCGWWWTRTPFGGRGPARLRGGLEGGVVRGGYYREVVVGSGWWGGGRSGAVAGTFRSGL